MALFNRHKEPLALPDPRKQPMAACDLSSITRGLQQAAAATQHLVAQQYIKLFDVYTGKGVEPGKKSLAFRIVMQDTQRTLQDAEVDAAMQQLITCLQQNFAAQLRV